MGPLLSIAAALALSAFVVYAGLRGLGSDSRDGHDWHAPGGPPQDPAARLHPEAVRSPGPARARLVAANRDRAPRRGDRGRRPVSR